MSQTKARFEHPTETVDLAKCSPSENDLDSYVIQMRNAPRLTALFDTFACLAIGTSGRPIHPVTADYSLLGEDALALAFLDVHRKCAGPFNAHFTASIPHILEEQGRLGAAIWTYGSALSFRKRRPARIYTLGDASGVTARALTHISGGVIHTLTCSPNHENRGQFYSMGAPTGAHFYLGPFFDVTPTSLRNAKLDAFADGFDVIIEDTTFQMYASERAEPITLACRNLREDGVFVMIEKVRHIDTEEYFRRERQKDGQFKSRYFDTSQISAKRQTVLACMQEQEATLLELESALRLQFSTAVITWNSGNFYTIVASNNSDNLVTFVNSMIAPAIPRQFLYEDLPRQLFGNLSEQFIFREPIVHNRS
jgi:hypothetical protein